MRGSGKTTVAKLLSRKLKWTIFDTDRIIEKQLQMPIKDFVKKNGWDKFRDLETKVLKQLNIKEKFILSTGGGIVLRKENRFLLKKSGLIFYLFARPKVLYQRIGEDKNRPFLTQSSNMLNDLQNLFEERKTIYEKNADCIIDTERLNVSSVVKKILCQINR